MSDDFDDALASLINDVNEIDEEDEEEELEAQKDATKKEIPKNENQSDHHDEKSKADDAKHTKDSSDEKNFQEEEEQISFFPKKVVKIDQKISSEIRRNEIMAQVEVVSKEISTHKDDQEDQKKDNQENEIDLDDFDIDWHFHSPTTK